MDTVRLICRSGFSRDSLAQKQLSRLKPLLQVPHG